MTKLLIGFDSAWTPNKSGALVGVLRRADGMLQELGIPIVVNFSDAERVIRDWQEEWKPTMTIQLLDQPTIVNNATGQRPVESIVGCIVGRRRGGMQPANRMRTEMFGENAPIWRHLNVFGGAVDPGKLFDRGGFGLKCFVIAVVCQNTIHSGRKLSCLRIVC